MGSTARESASAVRCDGSTGPGRGVMSCAESGELRDCERDRDAVEFDTGEQGLERYEAVVLYRRQK